MHWHDPPACCGLQCLLVALIGNAKHINPIDLHNVRHFQLAQFANTSRGEQLE